MAEPVMYRRIHLRSGWTYSTEDPNPQLNYDSFGDGDPYLDGVVFKDSLGATIYLNADSIEPIEVGSYTPWDPAELLTATAEGEVI